MKRRQSIIGVIGGGRESRRAVLRQAREIGRGIARAGAVLVCGGLEGVMRAAARGAREEGGITVGILPDPERGRENPYISVPVATGMGVGRNIIIARTADALIAVGGEYGTLSEIALGLNLGRPVVGLGTWDIPGVLSAEDPEEAVRIVLTAIRRTQPS